ncbi:MAG TPA: DUF3857 and transglutaminase domain-containing protein [Candidatus Polarisedimenticolia bacterium]|nr:DUF3857 and transglutaminase domain-containing protein [Candidatus Polarisedimenticolia bacterium]
MMRLVPIVIALIFASRVGGAGRQMQLPNESGLSAAAQLAAAVPSEFEQLLTRYHFENDGTGRKEVVGKIRILNATGVLRLGEAVFEYQPLSEELQIPYFRVKKKDGTLVSVDTDITQERPNAVPSKREYGERRIKIPDLSIGDLVEYDAVTIIHRPLGRSEFYVDHSFQPSGVVDEQLEVDIPRDREVRVKSIPTVRPREAINGTRKVYYWDNQNARTHPVRAIPYAPGGMPDVQISSFLSWKEVGRWYEDLEKSQRAVTPEVKAKAEELTQGLNSDFGKVLALYDFVAKKIKYLNLVSLGVEGYVPHAASETLQKQYGDCKDKVALFSALLEAEDLRASSALISPERDVDLDFPSPWPFTHVITTLHLGKEEIWLDPSPAGVPFRMLMPSLRGREALVIPLHGVPRFETTPMESPISNSWLEEVEGEMHDDRTFEGRVHITARGDVELPLRQAFIGAIESVWPTTVQGVVKGIDRKN